MAKDLTGYFSSSFTTEDIRSLPVPDAKFQEAKSGYLEQLIVTPAKLGKKIKTMNISPDNGNKDNDNISPVVDGIPPKPLRKQ